MSYKYADFIPDEWRSALRSGRRLFRVIHQTRAPALKFFVGYGLPVLLGLTYYAFVRPSLSTFAVSASITVIGLMAGFLMTLMLAIGKSDTLDYVDYETSRLVIQRLRFLLWSLTVTFLSYVATLAVGIALLTMATKGCAATPPAVPLFTAIFVAGLVLVFIRSIFLPLQIVELHQFQFEKILESKEKLRDEDVEARRKAALSTVDD